MCSNTPTHWGTLCLYRILCSKRTRICVDLSHGRASPIDLAPHTRKHATRFIEWQQGNFEKVGEQTSLGSGGQRHRMRVLMRWIVFAVRNCLAGLADSIQLQLGNFEGKFLSGPMHSMFSKLAVAMMEQSLWFHSGMSCVCVSWLNRPLATFVLTMKTLLRKPWNKIKIAISLTLNCRISESATIVQTKNKEHTFLSQTDMQIFSIHSSKTLSKHKVTVEVLYGSQPHIKSGWTQLQPMHILLCHTGQSQTTLLTQSSHESFPSL